MGDGMKTLIDQAKERLDSLRLIQERYPDAREGSIFGTPIISSQMAGRDTDLLAVFISGEDTVVLPYLGVGGCRVFFYGGDFISIDTLFERLRLTRPATFAVLLEECRK